MPTHNIASVYCMICDVIHAYCPHCRYGLDLIGGVVRDNKKVGVLEPAMSKVKSIKFATEAAITILRIDDMIKIAPEPKDEGSYADAVARGQL